MADGIAKMSWCYIITTNCLTYYMADVIAMWQMEWPLQGGSVGRCYGPWAKLCHGPKEAHLLLNM